MDYKRCICVQDEEELLLHLTEIMADNNLDFISIVADEDTTRKILKTAIYYDYEFKDILLIRDNCDVYITSLGNTNDEAYEIYVEEGFDEECGKYLPVDNLTYIQNNLPQKDKYIKDVKKYASANDIELRFFKIGESEPEVYTFHNTYDGNNCCATICVASTSKDYVDIMKKFFDDYWN